MILKGIAVTLTEMLADFKFNEPAEDEARIRQHAEVSGRRTQLLELLTYDDALREQFEQTVSSNLQGGE